MRTPDEILADFDAGCHGLADIDMRALLWEIIADIQDSYEIAMFASGIDAPAQIQIGNVVKDYLANHYGND